MQTPTSPDSPKIGAADRLSLTLFIASAVHAVIILGISFSNSASNSYVPPSLDVILLQSESQVAPEEADYLAQVNQTGGGENDLKARPQALFSAPNTEETQGIAPLLLEASTPENADQAADQVLSQNHSDHQVFLSDQTSDAIRLQKKPQQELVEHNLEMANLAAEINREVNDYAKRPRKAFAHARTKEAAAAAYMANWVEQVERVGNLNYPDQARRGKLQGSLVLVVGITATGHLHEVLLASSSGHKILDDAAMRIVELSAPYSAFPQRLKKETDILYITRTWRFQSNRLTSQ